MAHTQKVEIIYELRNHGMPVDQYIDEDEANEAYSFSQNTRGGNHTLHKITKVIITERIRG